MTPTDQRGSLVNSTKHLRKKYRQSSTSSFGNSRGNANSFYEVNISLMPKADKDQHLLCIDAKTLNRILANQIRQCIKRITHHNQERFTACMQTSSTFRVN